jgi:hypothetical protein
MTASATPQNYTTLTDVTWLMARNRCRGFENEAAGLTRPIPPSAARTRPARPQRVRRTFSSMHGQTTTETFFGAASKLSTPPCEKAFWRLTNGTSTLSVGNCRTWSFPVGCADCVVQATLVEICGTGVDDGPRPVPDGHAAPLLSTARSSGCWSGGCHQYTWLQAIV